jgi:hypothetical protein
MSRISLWRLEDIGVVLGPQVGDRRPPQIPLGLVLQAT